MSRRTVSFLALGVSLWASCLCYAQDRTPIAAFPEQEKFADAVDFDSGGDFLSDINFDDWDTPASNTPASNPPAAPVPSKTVTQDVFISEPAAEDDFMTGYEAEAAPVPAVDLPEEDSADSEVQALPAPKVDDLEAMTYELEEIAKPSVMIAETAYNKSAVRSQVKDLRAQRQSEMPFLSKGIVRDLIDSEQVRQRLYFVEGDTKKLQDLINRAIESHTPSKAAEERVSLAKRRIFAAVRELFPEFQLEYEDREGLITGGKFNSRGYHFNLKQPIFRGGALWNAMLEEKSELKAAKKEYDKLIEDLVNDVSESYFEYNRTLQVAKDQFQAIGEMERFAKISEQKFKEDLISEIEHLNVQSLFSQMKYDYETAKQELELAKLDLQSYLDLKLDDDIAVAPLYDMQALLDQSRQGDEPVVSIEDEAEPYTAPQAELPALTGLVDLAYKNRAELQIEAAKLESARLRERIEWAQMLPQADISLEMGALGEAFDSTTTHPKRTNEFRALLEFSWNMMGNTVSYDFENDENAPTVTQFPAGGSQTTRNTFRVDLLDGLDALADIKEAEAEKLDQIVELENAEKEVIQDVKQAYFDYQKALIQFKSSLQRLDYRERLARLSKHRLEQNEIQISEYIQAEIDLLQEQTELHGALKDYFAAKSALNRAVGIRNYLPIEDTYGQS